MEIHFSAASNKGILTNNCTLKCADDQKVMVSAT